nr:hypothetical protein CFP56_11543 [Quercus suber]
MDVPPVSVPSTTSSACLLCYRRKSKCVQSENDDIPGCEACRTAGVECITRLKNPLGRPKGRYTICHYNYHITRSAYDSSCAFRLWLINCTLGSRKQSWRINRNPVSSASAPAMLQGSREASAIGPDFSSASADSIRNASGLPDLSPQQTLNMSTDFLLATGGGQRPATDFRQHDRGRLLLHIFESNLELYTVSGYRISTIEEQYHVLSTLETFNQLIQDYNSVIPAVTAAAAAAAATGNGNGNQSTHWDLRDATLIILFLTALRAVAVCPRLVSELGSVSTYSALSSVSEFSSPSEQIPYQGPDNFTAVGLDMELLMPSLGMEDIDAAAFAGGQQSDSMAGNVDRNRAVALTRLDIFLFDVGRFHRQFSRLLLGAKVDQYVSSELLAKLNNQNEQCLSTLRDLHSQIQAHLASIPQPWQADSPAEWRTLG